MKPFEHPVCGTKEEIAAAYPAAKQWADDLLAEEIAKLSDTDRAFVEKRIADGTQLLRDVERSSSDFGRNATRYFVIVLNVAKSGAWSLTRLRIRKDGQVNMEILKTALKDWIARERRLQHQQEVARKNDGLRELTAGQNDAQPSRTKVGIVVYHPDIFTLRSVEIPAGKLGAARELTENYKAAMQRLAKEV